MPFWQITTLAPEETTESTMSLSIFSSCSIKAWICSGFSISILASISVFLISKAAFIRAILAFFTIRGMLWLSFSLSITMPLINSDSFTLCPLLFSILILFFIGLLFSSTTNFTASTTNSESFSFEYSAPFPVIAVSAIFFRISSSSLLTFSAILFRISWAFNSAVL